MRNRDLSYSDGELTVDKPATYCIQVVGYLDKNWSAHLGGLEIDVSKKDGRKAVTELSGLIIDQAALIGVIIALYDRRLPLLSVECLEVFGSQLKL